MNRAQLDRAERVARLADQQRKARRDRRDDELAGVLALAEAQAWKKPASLASGQRPVKRARVTTRFTDAQMRIALRSLEKSDGS